jgi:hypothetical protein
MDRSFLLGTARHISRHFDLLNNGDMAFCPDLPEINVAVVISKDIKVLTEKTLSCN